MEAAHRKFQRRLLRITQKDKVRKWRPGNPSQSYGASPAIRDHTVLLATWHRWTCPALTPARQAGTWFTYTGGMEGWVDLGGWLYTKTLHRSTV